MYADLHIHTTASDGADTPREVVRKALDKGLAAIAVSDHDTLAGVNEALQAAADFQLEVLSGVEVNTYYKGMEIHVLGYLIDPNNEEFTTTLRGLQEERLTRAEKMVGKLKKLGMKIKMSRVLELSGEGTVGRPHIARALLEKKYVSSMQEAFNQYIGAGKPAYVPREKLNPVEAIQLIIKAKGVPVLAHPGFSKVDHLLPSLIKAGLKGLEVWHRNHTPLMVEHYYKITKDCGLIPTGGSDYHGSHHDICNVIGGAVAPYESVQLLKDAVRDIIRAN